jgi:hypothetical protein
MDVSTLTVSGEEAARKVRVYSDIPPAKRTSIRPHPAGL